MRIGEQITDGLGRTFQIEQVYNPGGQGEAYRAKRIDQNSSESFVVKLYKDTEPNRIARLDRIISQAPTLSHGFPDKTFCFPTTTIQMNGREGVVMPHAPGTKMSDGLFESPDNSPHSPTAFRAVTSVSIKYKVFLLNAFHLARSIDQLYSNGYTHCDLSINNLFVDTSNGQISIIDLDNLAVENFLPAKVMGTHGFIAPELEIGTYINPDNATDAHSLAVLIFYLLMFRHPLVGSDMNVSFADDPFGRNALYTDHPTDSGNRFRGGIPVTDLPASIQMLFTRAFINGLHHRADRPTARSWLKPLWSALDLLLTCENCRNTYFFSNHCPSVCMFCGTKNLGPFARLKFINGYEKVLGGGSVFYPHHFFGRVKEFDMTNALADVKLHTDGRLIFANRGEHSIEIVFAGGSRKTITQGQGVDLSGVQNIIFEFGQSATVEFFNRG